MWRNQSCGPALTPVRPRIIAWPSTLTVSACYPDASSTTKIAAERVGDGAWPVTEAGFGRT